nr:hypothetical protein Itr_chr10CG04180 [Ipomoea trifida]
MTILWKNGGWNLQRENGIAGQEIRRRDEEETQAKPKEKKLENVAAKIPPRCRRSSSLDCPPAAPINLQIITLSHFLNLDQLLDLRNQRMELPGRKYGGGMRRKPRGDWRI